MSATIVPFTVIAGGKRPPKPPRSDYLSVLMRDIETLARVRPDKVPIVYTLVVSLLASTKRPGA